MRCCLVLLALLMFVGFLPVVGAAACESAAAPAGMVRDARCRQFVATCLVEGRPARLMVDTGATHTVLAADFVARQLPDLSFVEGVELKGNAEQRPRLAMAALQAGELRLASAPVLVMGLEGVNSMLGQRVDGILGMSHLVFLPFTLDLREGGQGYWGVPGERLPLRPLTGLREGSGRLVLEARCEGAACRLLLDTGSTVTTWPQGKWPAGVVSEESVRVGDVNGARSAKLSYGRAAALRLGRELVLPRVSPQLRPEAGGHVLGLDALEGGVLVHRPGEGFYLLPPKNEK